MNAAAAQGPPGRHRPRHGEGPRGQPGTAAAFSSRKAGRIVMNGVPPASGDPPCTTVARHERLARDVGRTAAIVRFARPVCFQDVPNSALPEAARPQPARHLAPARQAPREPVPAGAEAAARGCAAGHWPDGSGRRLAHRGEPTRVVARQPTGRPRGQRRAFLLEQDRLPGRRLRAARPTRRRRAAGAPYASSARSSSSTTPAAWAPATADRRADARAPKAARLARCASTRRGHRGSRTEADGAVDRERSAFCHARTSRSTCGVGRVTGDVAWGGNWFFLTRLRAPASRQRNASLTGSTDQGRCATA